jgi:integrase
MTVEAVAEVLAPAKDAISTNYEKQRVGSRCTIFKSGSSPKWYIGFSDGGRQYRKSLKTTNKKQAIRLAQNYDAKLVLGHLNDKKECTLPELVSAYKSFVQRHEKPGTLKSYSIDLNDLLAYTNWRSVTKATALNAQFLEEYEDFLAKKGMEGIIVHRPKTAKRRPVGQQTLHKKLKIVKQMMNWAVERAMLREDPSKGYRIPSRPDDQAYCWSPEEVNKLRQRARPNYLDTYDFLRLTGIRVDEFCWLELCDLDLERGFIFIRAKKCKQTGKEWEPKHGGERIVPLCPEAVEIARRAAATSQGPWLFYAPNTRRRQLGHYTPHRIWTSVKSAMKRAGLTRGTTHTFRHVFCSFLANNNVPPLQVMKIMGHQSLDIILAYYHVTDDQLRDAVKGLSFAAMLVTNEKG